MNPTVQHLIATPDGRNALKAEYAKRVRPYQFYGRNLQFHQATDHERILSGPRDTGKTITTLSLLNWTAWEYPGARMAIVMDKYSVMPSSVLQTWENEILPPTWRADEMITVYGGRKPEWYDYPNGTRIYCVGMDSSNKVLGSALDVICVSQAERLRMDDWELLTSSASGRAGNIPSPFVMGDANPDHPRHWILQRQKSGKLRLVNSRHVDNPTIYDLLTGELTKSGKLRIDVLKKLTGVRYRRLFLGEWAQADGVVYPEFDWDVHVIERSAFNWAAVTRWVVGIDWGYSGPGVAQLWGVTYDGDMILSKEIYRTSRRVEWWLGCVLEWAAECTIEAVVYDSAEPEHASMFNDAGLNTVPSWKQSIALRLDAVRGRLVSRDGRPPRILICNDSVIVGVDLPKTHHDFGYDASLEERRLPTRTSEEFSLYVMGTDRSGNIIGELPVKANDHGMDAMGYVVAYLDNLGGDRKREVWAM